FRLCPRYDPAAAIQNAHIEAESRAARERLPDAAHADDSKGLAVHVDSIMGLADGAAPLPRLHPCRQFDDPTRACQQQREYRIRGRLVEDIGRVGQQDSPLAKVLQVEIIVADGDGRDRLHRRRRLQLRAPNGYARTEHSVYIAKRSSESGITV